MRIKGFYVSAYLMIALSISASVQYGYWDRWFYDTFSHPIFTNASYLLAGLGTLLGGGICLFLDKDLANKVSFFGIEKRKNTLILFLPLLAFTLTGLDNAIHWNPHLFGFTYALIHTVYAFTEEFGWRRYLQNALQGWNKHVSLLSIGSIWWIWHFRFTTDFELYLFPMICIGGGYVLGKLADDFGSFLPAVSMHTLIILLSNTGAMGVEKWAALGLVILLWILIEKLITEKKSFEKKE